MGPFVLQFLKKNEFSSTLHRSFSPHAPNLSQLSTLYSATRSVPPFLCAALHICLASSTLIPVMLLLWYTIPIMILSELPLYLFGLFDWLALDSVAPYRIHYRNDKMTVRPYPSHRELMRSGSWAFFVFLTAYLIPAIIGIGISESFGIQVRDSRSPRPLRMDELLTLKKIWVIALSHGRHFFLSYMC